MLGIKNYHEESVKHEKYYADEILLLFSLLLKQLNEIENLSKPSIDAVIGGWKLKNKMAIDALNREHVVKLNDFTNRIIPNKIPESTQNEDVNRLTNAGNQMLDVTTVFVEQKFKELAILENEYNFSPEKATEFLQQTANSTEDKIITFATMSTISNIRELVLDRVEFAGYTEYFWMTQRDSKVRKLHALMDGKWFPLRDLMPQPAGCQPSVDYGCRCWMAKFR